MAKRAAFYSTVHLAAADRAYADAARRADEAVAEEREARRAYMRSHGPAAMAAAASRLDRSQAQSRRVLAELAAERRRAEKRVEDAAKRDRGRAPTQGRLFNPGKRDRRGFDAYTPDLFGGAHKERGEGKSKAEQMEFARQEMRDTGSNSLFDLLDEPKRKNPGDRVSGLTLGVLALAAVAALHCGRHVVAMRQVGRPILPWGATWPLGSSTA